MRLSEKLKTYYAMTKPGIIYGNLLTAAGGFLFGAILRINLWLLLLTLAGTALVIGGGCVTNNYLDRDIDAKMKRTKKRALVNGTVPTRNALIFATLLTVAGLLLLVSYVNVLTALIGLVGFISYTFVYTFAKRLTVHGTLIGTLPGALPPIAGYAAATGRLDVSALILFIIMVCWQMAHFYSIALFRLKDYKAAKIPVMPAVYGVYVTKLQIMVYIGGFLLAVVCLAKFSYAGVFYLAIMTPLGLWWLFNAMNGITANNHEAWARKMFFISLIMLPALCLALALNAYLP